MKTMKQYLSVKKKVNLNESFNPGIKNIYDLLVVSVVGDQVIVYLTKNCEKYLQYRSDELMD